MKLTQEHLRELLDYDPETGVFTWRVERSGKGRNGTRAGDRAGWIDCSPKKGYRYIEIDDQKYVASRLAWLYMIGKWPKEEIDHKDRDTVNDAWNNLRECSKLDNCANRNLRRDNTSGARGVNWNKRQQQWIARIMRNGQSFYLGTFDSFEEAKRVRDERAAELYGEFNSVLD